jgi:hypothetical protein
VAAGLARLSVGTGQAWALGLARQLSGREFCSRQKGGDSVGKTKRGKGTKWMVVVDGQGIPLGSHLTSAFPAEVTLAETTLEAVSVPRSGSGRPKKRPMRLIADRGNDSDPLRWRLLPKGLLLISPHRKNRRAASFNDGHASQVSQTLENGRLGSFRRLVVRYDRRLCMYRAFIHLACALITTRFLLK